MDSLPTVVGNTHKEKLMKMKMKSLYTKVVIKLNNLHSCLNLPPKRETKRNRAPTKPIKSEKKRLEKKKTHFIFLEKIFHQVN